jgi:hypothetical protein
MSQNNVASLVFLSGLLTLGLAAQAAAETFTEQNRKVTYLRDTGSGPDQKHAAIKLDNLDSLAAGCFEDILILDVSTEAGKKTHAQLKGLLESKATVKSITFSKDEEGDCRLESLQP